MRFLPVLLAALVGATSANPVDASKPGRTPFSWKGTKFLFTFGDSYTTTGWNVSAGLDSVNPQYTASDGFNWVNYLNQTFNESVIITRDLASGGATIDSRLVTPYLPTVISLKGQVQQFVEYFYPVPKEVPWSSDNTLFAIWIGINDVGNSALWNNITQIGFHDVLLTEWEGLMNTLYGAGARNFLFLNVPALEKAPLFSEQGPNVTSLMNVGALTYNSQLAQYAGKLAAQHPDANYWVYDTHTVFETIIQNYKVYGFKNATEYCVAYENGTPTQTYFDPSCLYPVQDYFWLNSLHPTYPVHRYLAQDIAKFLVSV